MRGRRDGGGDGILARDETRGSKVALVGGFVEYMVALRVYDFGMNTLAMLIHAIVLLS